MGKFKMGSGTPAPVKKKETPTSNDKIVEIIKEVEKIVEVPVEVTKEVIREVKVPVEKIVEKKVKEIVYVDKPVQVIKEVIKEIENDMQKAHPMHRLLQGEVGSGKTVIALRAALSVIESGGQAALLAPTEVLAVQHGKTIEKLLGELSFGGTIIGGEFGTQISLLTGSMSKENKKKELARIASGEVGIVVGTHALIQDGVEFKDLALVIVDEQHRFGVEQRDALRMKAKVPPHLLVMTATPIPRTVAMTIFGDLDISTLRQLPGGRSPIATHVIPVLEKPKYLERAWERIKERVALCSSPSSPVKVTSASGFDASAIKVWSMIFR